MKTINKYPKTTGLTILLIVIFGLFLAAYPLGHVFASMVCTSASDCGLNAWSGGPFCIGNNVYQDYITYTCNNPGTDTSFCTHTTLGTFQTNCGSQTCVQGTCANPSIACYSASDCGLNAWSGAPFCVSNNIYQNYRTYTCINPGTGASFCTHTTLAKQQTNCTNGQTCSNGTCTNTCTSNYQARCSGNNLYWYDSCNNQQSLIQYCASGCSGNTCNGYNYNVAISGVTKTVKNLTNGSGFAASTYANPSDVVMFLITVQVPGNQSIQNVIVRDTLPANLIYRNQLVVAVSNNAYINYSGDIITGLSITTIPAGQTVTISYQAQVASVQNFSYGTSTLTNNVYVTSSNYGYNQSANASVIVTRSTVLGASTVSTGLTNNFWVDSFFLPLLITVIFIFMWRFGLFSGIEKWLNEKRGEKRLSSRIAKIKKANR